MSMNVGNPALSMNYGGSNTSIISTANVYTSPAYTGSNIYMVTNNPPGRYKNRGPYKKDKFRVRTELVLRGTIDEKVSIGKVKTLAQLGELFDKLDPNESISISVTKEP